MKTAGEETSEMVQRKTCGRFGMFCVFHAFNRIPMGKSRSTTHDANTQEADGKGVFVDICFIAQAPYVHWVSLSMFVCLLVCLLVYLFVS